MITNNSGLKMHKDFCVCVWIWSRVNWLVCLIQAPEVQTLTVSAALTQLETEQRKLNITPRRKMNITYLFLTKLYPKKMRKYQTKMKIEMIYQIFIKMWKAKSASFGGTLCERAVWSLRRGYFLSSSVFHLSTIPLWGFQTAFSHYLQSSFERLTRIFISSSSCRRR